MMVLKKTRTPCFGPPGPFVSFEWSVSLLQSRSDQYDQRLAMKTIIALMLFVLARIKKNERV